MIKICTNNIIKCTRRLSLLVLRVNEGNNHPGLYYVYFNDLLIMSKSYWLSSIIKLKDMSLWHYRHFELKQWKFFMHALKSSGHYRFGSITCTLSLNWLIEGLYLSTCVSRVFNSFPFQNPRKNSFSISIPYLSVYRLPRYLIILFLIFAAHKCKLTVRRKINTSWKLSCLQQTMHMTLRDLLLFKYYKQYIQVILNRYTHLGT